jgi:hypothetical protein
MNAAKPRRRWCQFRLRTLLIGVAVVAAFCPAGARFFREWQKQHELENQIEQAMELISKGGSWGTTLYEDPAVAEAEKRWRQGRR